jgi:hypothetical protein
MPLPVRSLRLTASGFDPRKISGIEGWWDAADASTVTLDSGRVSTWADKSDKRRNATNSTSGSTQPDYVTAARNGRNVVRFAAASSQFLQAGSVGNWNFLHNGTNSSIFMVVRCFDSSDPNAGGSILSTGGGSSAQIGFDFFFDDRASVPRNNAVGVAVARSVTSQFTSNDATQDVLTPNTYAVCEVLLDGDNATAANRSRSRVNGGTQFGSNTFTNAPSTSNSSYTLAFARGQFATPGFFFTGDICEMLLYSQHPTTDAQAAIRRYLASKWGVTLA